MKIGARVPALWFNKSFGPNCLKPSFQTPDPWVKVYFNFLGVHQIFPWILDKKKKTFDFANWNQGSGLTAL